MLARRVPRFYTLPEVVSGAPLTHFVGVIIPLARTNMITNPSIETATTNYTASGGSIARSATKQYHGTYSLAITPTSATTDGAFYGTVSLTSGTTYALSCKFWGLPGVKYKISFATTGGVDLAVKPFIGTGRWQWVWILYNETSTTTRRLYFTKNTHTSTGVFYIDGVQVESCADGILAPTTYIDGDQIGLLVGQQPPAYGWDGTPHASTSYRTALTRAGGYVVDIKTAYGFLLTALVGLGMATPNNVSIPYTVQDGARYQRTTKPPRTIGLAGRFQATTPAQLNRLRSDMRAAFDRDLVPLQQPLVLMVEPRDECGDPTGDFATVPCIYAGGLEGNDTSALAEDAAPAFTMYVPFLSGGDAGASLTVQQSVSNANNIAKRTAAGQWQSMSSAFNGTIQSIAIGLDGSIYVTGSFTAPQTRIARWDGTTWQAMGTGLNDTGQELAVAPNGDVYVGGFFTSAGGVANTNRIARWDGSAWNALSTGANGDVYALAFAPGGTLYVGGNFTTIGGVAATRVASWNGSAFSALGTGADSFVYSLAVAANGTLYACGAFTNAGGTAVNMVAKWNGSAWSSMAGGIAGAAPVAYTLAIGANNAVYLGGFFSTAGGVSASNIAAWNGTGWTPLGSGVNDTVWSVATAPNGLLYVSGQFTSAGGISIADRFALWNGSSWLLPDVDLPGTPTITAIRPVPSGELYLGYDTTGTATAAGITTVTNTTPGYVWPRLVVKGPSSGTSRLHQIVNYTVGTRSGIWLNYTISAGETITLTTDPQNPSFISTFRGDITDAILPGSQLSQFYLAPGSNSISFFAASSTVTATLSWQNHYNGVADLVN